MRTKPAVDAPRSRQSRIEALDPRLMMSVNVTVNAAKQYQTVTGWGTSLYNNTFVPYAPAQAGTALYQNFVNDYANDLGATMLRINAQADVLPTVPTTPFGTDLQANIAMLNLKSSNAYYQGLLAQALTQADGGKLQVVATIWSPPAYMKANDSLNSTDLLSNYTDPLNHLLYQDNNPADVAVQTNMLDPTNLTQFARYCAAYVAGMEQTYGINIVGLSIQNEPLFNETFDSCTYYEDTSKSATDVQYRRYAQAVKAVGEELYGDGLNTTIMGPESVGPDNNQANMTSRQEALLQAVLNDNVPDQYGKVAADYMGAVAIHGWNGDHVNAASDAQWWAPYESYLQANDPSAPSWQTETETGGTTWLGTTSAGATTPLLGAISLGLQIHDTMETGDASVFLYWQIANGSSTANSYTLMDSTAATVANPDRTDLPQWNFEVYKHWSKFVVPGSIRIGTSYTDGSGNAIAEDPTTVNTDAYIDPVGKTATLELTNASASPQTVNISLANLSLTSFNQAWLTDATDVWTNLGPVTVANGIATLTVPAYSIVTLQGSTAPAVTTGTVSGTVYVDANGDGAREAGEPGAAGQSLYLDLNGNGTYDAGTDPTTTTAADGTYSFTSVPAGTYKIYLTTAGWRQTAPALNGPQTAVVTAGGTVTGADFGVVQNVVISPPVAVPGGPYTVATGAAVQLNGAGSYETNGSIATYQWDLSYNGTTFNVDTTGATPTFSATGLTPQTDTVALRVIGADGQVSPVVTTTVTVVAQISAPVAVPGGPYAVAPGAAIQLNGQGSYETNGSIATYQWDLNYNGTTFNPTATGATPNFSASGLTAQTVTVALRVVGVDGQVSPIATTTVAVGSVGPTTATLTGTVSARSANGTTTGLANVVVYLDENLDGTLDSTDPSTTTSSTGTYTFPNLTPGFYRIRQVLPAGTTVVSPASHYRPAFFLTQP
jgi:O-glycosyl hydrolase